MAFVEVKVTSVVHVFGPVTASSTCNFKASGALYP